MNYIYFEGSQHAIKSEPLLHITPSKENIIKWILNILIPRYHYIIHLRELKILFSSKNRRNHKTGKFRLHNIFC